MRPVAMNDEREIREGKNEGEKKRQCGCALSCVHERVEMRVQHKWLAVPHMGCR